MNVVEQEEVIRLLLAWYDRQARVLPWRSQPTPYRVWISEIMLQQTQVNTVLPYFERFMVALPDVWALASVDQEQLYKLWEGLGYYSRARNLKRAAELLTDQYVGQLPASYEELLKLPGIGEYTAGAIASIAFGLPVAAVDGNVLRVFARMMNDDGDIADAKVKKRFRQMVNQWVPQERPGDFNQSLMELGARICTPKAAPACQQCPIVQHCQAKAANRIHLLPVKTGKKTRAIQKRAVLLLISGDKILVQKRPSKGLLAGLWEYPALEGWVTEAELMVLLQEQGLSPLHIWPTIGAKHIFTHREWHMQGWIVSLSNTPSMLKGHWITKEQLLETYAVPGAYKAYTDLVPDLLMQK